MSLSPPQITYLFNYVVQKCIWRAFSLVHETYYIISLIKFRLEKPNKRPKVVEDWVALTFTLLRTFFFHMGLAKKITQTREHIYESQVKAKTRTTESAFGLYFDLWVATEQFAKKLRKNAYARVEKNWQSCVNGWFWCEDPAIFVQNTMCRFHGASSWSSLLLSHSCWLWYAAFCFRSGAFSQYDVRLLVKRVATRQMNPRLTDWLADWLRPEWQR